MRPNRICVAVALQRYLDFTPIALRQRELAGFLAKKHNAPCDVLSVDAPIPLLPDVETTEDKLKRFIEPLAAIGVDVAWALRQGRPSREIEAFAVESGADLLIIGSHSKRGPLDVGLGSTASNLTREGRVSTYMVWPTVEEQERARELMIPRYPLIFPYG